MKSSIISRILKFVYMYRKVLMRVLSFIVFNLWVVFVMAPDVFEMSLFEVMDDAYYGVLDGFARRKLEFWGILVGILDAVLSVFIYYGVKSAMKESSKRK